jgi:hypothetical protein
MTHLHLSKNSRKDNGAQSVRCLIFTIIERARK